MHAPLLKIIEAVCKEHGWQGKTGRDGHGRWLCVIGFHQPAWAGGIAFMFEPESETLSVYVDFNRQIATRRRAKVAELVNRINYGETTGSLEFDLESGDLRVRASMFAGAQRPTRTLVDHVVAAALDFAGHYFDVVADVIEGEDPKEALSKARAA